MSIVIFLIILLVLVLVHEFGHFYSAKKFGIRVDEFGFGFPPKVFGKKFGETEYSFNLLPIGGFVRIFGENPDAENISGPDSARSFVNKPRWQQAVVLSAGVFANFLLAWLLFSISFMSGFPTSVGSVIDASKLKDVNLVILSVSPDSPAEDVGLISGDKIISIADYKYAATPDEKGEGKILGREELNPESFKKFIVSHPNEQLTIIYERNNERGLKGIIPRVENNEPKIGISMDNIGIAQLPFFSALKEGMKLTVVATKETALGLGRLLFDSLKGQGSLDGVTGPVGLVGIVGDAYSFGFSYLLSFTAIISINLAVINLIPFPALDGGRLFFLLIEKIKGSRINQKFFNYANIIGFSFLILFMLVITYHDIRNLF